MNFKLNLWTLLFLLALGALVYLNTDQFKSEISSPQKMKIMYEIDSTEFFHYKANYDSSYLPVIRNPKLHLKDSVGVEYIGMEAYKLQLTELDQIFAFYEFLYKKSNSTIKPDVFIYPIIKDSISNGITIKRDFDLAFLITNGNTADQRFFDFTEPCPPVCGIPYTSGCVPNLTY